MNGWNTLAGSGALHGRGIAGIGLQTFNYEVPEINKGADDLLACVRDDSASWDVKRRDIAIGKKIK